MEVSLTEMLEAREKRAWQQRETRADDDLLHDEQCGPHQKQPPDRQRL